MRNKEHAYKHNVMARTYLPRSRLPATAANGNTDGTVNIEVVL